jgi:broad specificity phosphatase PhoE
MQLEDWANEGHAWEELGLSLEDGGYTWSFYEPDTRKKFRSDEVRNLGKKWYEYPHFKKDFSIGIRRIDKAADEFFERLGYKHDRENNGFICLGENRKRVALFAHQGFGIAFLSSILDIPYPLFSTSFDFSHSSITAIWFDCEAKAGETVYPKVLQLSNDSHLVGEGLFVPYNNLIQL